MMNKYFKALLLTVFLLLGGLAVTRFADDSRLNQLSVTLEKSALDSQSTQHLLLYESIFPEKENICPVLSTQIDVEIEKTRSALAQLEAGQAQSFLTNYDLLKRKYLNQNIELYLYVQKALRDCGQIIKMKPVLFFYSDKDYCPDCISQGKILDSLQQKCDSVRVFAMPIDLGIPVVDLLKVKYDVSAGPSLVINDNTYLGLIPQEQLERQLNC